ncbi:MAG: hypothetical protein IGR76_10955 [Synechococcales cyanobacterium T60_A2020_003]|nr:hypothetical protein [Synechococcales cyanobacterium T60_A2020_003]
MQSLVWKVAIWLLAEVLLTSVGLDDLADYGEYTFKMRDLLPSQRISLMQYDCQNGFCHSAELPPQLNFFAAYRSALQA